VLAVVIQSLRDRRGFGGVASLTASTAVETLLSALLAPVLMLLACTCR
jgi:membrane glycosyltransferase